MSLPQLTRVPVGALSASQHGPGQKPWLRRKISTFCERQNTSSRRKSSDVVKILQIIMIFYTDFLSFTKLLS